MSGHDLQILYTIHFHHNSELRFCRKYFGLQTTYISGLNVLSFQETVFGRVLSFMLHTLTLSTQTYNQIDKSSVSIYVPKFSSNVLISIFFWRGGGFIKQRRAVFVLFASLHFFLVLVVVVDLFLFLFLFK